MLETEQTNSVNKIVGEIKSKVSQRKTTLLTSETFIAISKFFTYVTQLFKNNYCWNKRVFSSKLIVIYLIMITRCRW